MSDKSDEESILGSLPATRPTRFGAERRKTGGGGTATATKSKPKTAAAKSATRAAAAKQKAAAPEPKVKAKPRTPAAASPPSHKPRPVRAGAPSLAESTRRARTSEPPPESKTSPPSGTELVTTAIQAAGELAQIGIAVGGQVLKRAVDRLPKP
jgi:hypothetical protein